MNALCSEYLKKNNTPVSKSDQQSHEPATATLSKKKVKKDPNAPKAPKTSYVFFCAHVRQKYPEKLKEIKFADQSAILGREWAKLPEAKKNIFKGLQDKDKKRYEKDLAQYEAEHGIVKKAPSKRKRGVVVQQIVKQQSTPKQPNQSEESNVEQDDNIEIAAQDDSQQESIPEVEEKPKKKVKK